MQTARTAQPALPRFERMLGISAELSNIAIERVRVLQRLAITVLVLIALVTAWSISSIWRGTTTDALLSPALFQVFVAAAVTAIVIVLIRRDRLELATSVFLYGTLAINVLLLHLYGGSTGPAMVWFLFPVVAAGLFGRSLDSIRLLGASMFLFVLYSVGQQLGWIVPILSGAATASSLTFGVSLLTIGGLLTYLAVFWSQSTQRFLSRQDAQSEELYQINQRLMEKNIQQVELGNDLAQSASELLTASHEQASGATEQASAVSEVSTTIEELGSTARQIALAAEQVAQASGQTLENLSEGQDAVDRSIQAMDRIRSRMQDVSSRVLNLGERSQQIGEIIDLINDLSDETHLLALNAAIEAAGAGEHGRRFAVVAAEVKSLANRALAAAKEVKGVIAEIQQATNSAVLAAEEGGKEVERGVELAHSAGQVMNEIVMVAERTAQSGAEISLATAQQQSASEQVVETMREIADVARRTATGARQVQDAAQRLTMIANRLHGLASSQD
jgi:methyl-accepting chemotaxis protein